MKHLSLVATATDFAALEAADETVDETTSTTNPFQGVPAAIRAALEDRGFDELMVVQRAVLAEEAAERDLQISSQTGSGKTVALGLVMAPRLLKKSKVSKAGKPIRALVIVPTRELAVQVGGELEWLYSQVPGLLVETVTGGSSVGQERRRLERRPSVVVGTPGRMLDHIRRGAIDCGEVTQVILDEADRMLDMGFREELEGILEATPAERRTHLVSATFSPVVQKMAHKYQNDPLTVEGTRLGAANADIEHVGHLLHRQDRYAAIINLILLSQDERALVFVNTRAEASQLADQLANDGFSAAPISGELEQAERTRTLDSFRSGNTTVLVATDVAARGLDIPEVGLVIHTDAPMDSESYTHRAGRTGRAGRKGRSVLLVTPQRRKKVEFLLRRAKVEMQWREVPTAATVEKSLAKRARRRLYDALAAAPEPDEKQLTHATKLMEEMDPTILIARLVELCRGTEKASAQTVKPVSAPPARSYDQDRRQDRYNDRGGRPQYRDDRESRDRGGYRDERPNYGDRPRYQDRGRDRYEDRNQDSRQPREGRTPRNFDPSPAHFEINWGRRDGATPQRLLAFLCRRGDVTSRVIGSIDIEHDTTTFQISNDAARSFEHCASQPDRRDPHLIIRRAHSGRH